MNTQLKLLAMSTMVVGLCVAATVQADRETIAQLANAKISLTEAIAIAETDLGGVAYEAKLDDDSFAPEYEVEVAVDGTAWEITIDGVSGKVLRTKEERDD